MSRYIPEGCEECGAVHRGPGCSPGPCRVNLCCLERPMQRRGLDRPQDLPGCRGWAASRLAACTPGCVCSAASRAWRQKKSQTRLRSWERWGCFGREKEDIVTTLGQVVRDWLEKLRASQSLRMSSDLQVRGEISELHRQFLFLLSSQR